MWWYICVCPGTMKICDFGLSISALGEGEEGGTLPYMAPECLKLLDVHATVRSATTRYLCPTFDVTTMTDCTGELSHVVPGK